MIIVLVLLSPVSVPLFLLLLVLFVIGIQVERGGWWRALYPFTAFGLVLDVVLAHTLLPVYMADYPARGEWTYSQHLKRLVRTSGDYGDLARYVAGILNAIAPGHNHI